MAPSRKGMADFNSMIVDVGLFEMEYKGPGFAWDNKKLGSNLVLSKINRGFCNLPLINSCQNSWVDIFSTTVSDHKYLTAVIDHNILNRKIPFRHINAWTRFPEYEKIIKDSWCIPTEGCLMYRVVSKLKNVQKNLSLWNKNKAGDIHKWADESLEIVEAIQRRFDEDPSNEEIQRQLKEAKGIVDEAYSIEESFLGQKSRCIWLK